MRCDFPTVPGRCAVHARQDRRFRLGARTAQRFFLAVAVSCLSAAAGGAAMFEKDDFLIDGDFRARLEADFDSQQADGSERADRTRLRIRARVRLKVAASDHFTFGLRLRSGSDDSQQSPHITAIDFDGNDTGDADLNFDQWYLRGEVTKNWAWIGRNGLPLWKQNEFLWDDDVTPAGLAFGTERSRGDSGFAASGGYFSLPAGMREFSGNLATAQVVFRRKKLTTAFGLLDIDADADDPDGALLLRGNGARDYQIFVANLQAELGRWTVGVDWLHNGESYPAGDPLRREVDGAVGSVKFAPHSGWWAAYTYAYVEAYAAHSSYAQDDWVRWGSATQTRASDLKGHELRWVRNLGSGQKVDLRLFFAEAITTAEDGNRLRIDYNYAF